MYSQEEADVLIDPELLKMQCMKSINERLIYARSIFPYKYQTCYILRKLYRLNGIKYR